MPPPRCGLLCGDWLEAAHSNHRLRRLSSFSGTAAATSVLMSDRSQVVAAGMQQQNCFQLTILNSMSMTFSKSCRVVEEWQY